MKTKIKGGNVNLKVSDFKIPEELEEYKKALVKFAREVLDPLADKIDKEDSVPEKVLPLVRDAGLIALPCPKEYGGMGLSLSQWWPIMEIAGGVGGNIRLIPHNSSAMWKMIYARGTEEQKRKYLEPFVKAEKLASFALTEPDCGSGTDIQTTATKQGDHFILNGRKHLITPRGPLAKPFDFCHVVAYSKDRSLRGKGISMFIVDVDAPGFSWSPMPDFIGLHGYPHLVLNFNNCIVPAENLIGEEGNGLDLALETFLTPSRWSIGISCLGLAQRMLELAIEHSKVRVTFGKTIASRQAIQQILAEMATNIYALRMMIADVGLKLDRGLNPAVEASMCKNFGDKVSRQVSDAALEIYGGIGACSAYPIERLYREARTLWLEEGTPTIHGLIISRDLLSS